MKKRFVIEIEVDEKNIAKKYPNYNFNYQTIEQFIESEILCSSDNECDTAEANLDRWGFCKRLIKE